MRRHIIVLALAVGATGAGYTAHRIVTNEPEHTGVVVGAKEPAGAGGTAGAGRGAAMTKARPLNAARLRESVRDYLAARPGHAGVMATDLRTGLSFGENETADFVSASVIKVDILASLLLQRQRDHTGLGLTSGERELAGSMIRESDNSAADALYSKVGGGSGVRKANKRLGLTNTRPYPGSWGSTWTNPADQVRLLRALVSERSPIGAAGRGYVLGLMGSVLDEQAWGVSAAARPGEKVALKNGWTPVRHQGHGWAVNSVGRVTGPDHDFLVAVCSGDSPTMEAGVATVEHVADIVVDAMRTAGT